MKAPQFQSWNAETGQLTVLYLSGDSYLWAQLLPQLQFRRQFLSQGAPVTEQRTTMFRPTILQPCRSTITFSILEAIILLTKKFLTLHDNYSQRPVWSSDSHNRYLSILHTLASSFPIRNLEASLTYACDKSTQWCQTDSRGHTKPTSHYNLKVFGHLYRFATSYPIAANMIARDSTYFTYEHH